MGKNTTCALSECSNETGGTKYCSQYCKGRAAYEKRLQKMPRCSHCGGPYQSGKSVDPRGFCNNCTPAKRVANNDGTGTCVSCGSAFRNGRKSRLYSKCSQCRYADQKMRGVTLGACSLDWCDAPQFCKGWCSRHYWNQYFGQPFTAIIPCDVCGDPLEYVRRDQRDSERLVHSRCNKDRLRFVSDKDRQSIYQRDEFTCQICGDPVDRHRGEWTPWTASLDHIIPRSSTEVWDNSAENLRCVHSICNTLRGAAALTDEEVVVRLREWEVANV